MKMVQTLAIVALSCFFLFANIKVDSLEVGYYKCPDGCAQAEDISRVIVSQALRKDRGIGAGLIRLYFHDCFVRGCDASVLLDESPANPNPEKYAGANLGLRGLDVIDDIKKAVDLACGRRKVSCADIIAFAARDASYILSKGRTTYEVAAGRLDGKKSDASEAQNTLPGHDMNLDALKNAFLPKGLTIEDIVVLSGAHTIGRAHCPNVTPRLYPNVDPTLNNDLADDLKNQCPDNDNDNDDDNDNYNDKKHYKNHHKNKNDNGVVYLDDKTRDDLDGQYYNNLLVNRVVFFSDWVLLTSDETKALVDEYATEGTWEKDFGESMMNLGKLTSEEDGEIRDSCNAVNSY